MFKKISIFALTLLATLGLATPAMAAPVIIVGAVLGAAVGIGAAVLVTASVGLIAAAAVVGAVVGVAAATVLSDGIMGSFDVPEFDGGTNDNPIAAAQAENHGIMIDKQGTLEHLPVVYGTRMIAGTRVFVTTNGENNKYLYIAIALCEGEIDSIGEVFFDDVLATDEMYAGRYEIQKFTGSDNQSASSLLQEAPGWSSDHRLRGIAYLAVRLEWKPIESNEDARQNPFSGIPRIKCIVRGKKTANASTAGSVTYENEFVGYSTNPADHLLDYLRNPRFGKGLENARINFASFATAHGKFNQNVRYHNSGHSGPMLTSNAVIDTKKKLMDNVKIFLNNMRCGMPYVQGKFKLKLLDTGNGSDSQNTTVTSVFDITMNELTEGIQVEGMSTRSQYNQVLLTYPSPGSNWEMSEVTYPIPDSQEDIDYLAQDNGRRLQKTISFPHVTEPAIAGDLAHIILKRSRGKKIITFKTTAECHEVEVGDIVTITYAPLGFSSAKYRIQSMKVEPDYTISFQALEHEPTEYVFRENNFVSVAPKVYYVPYNSPKTEVFLQEQAAVQAPYVPAVVFNPSVNNNGVIRTRDAAGSNLVATGIGRDASEETFRFTWTPPDDVFQFHSVLVYSRRDYRGETQFGLINSFNDTSITSFEETFGRGPRTYSVRIFYKTWEGQYSKPLEVTLTTITRYGTNIAYTSGVNVFNGTVVNL